MVKVKERGSGPFYPLKCLDQSVDRYHRKPYSVLLLRGGNLEIKIRRLDRWDKSIRKRLRYATLSYGYLKRYMRSFPKSPTIVAFSGKHVMGWALALHHNNEIIVSFFTNKRYRRVGVATRLGREALKKFHAISVVGWDRASKKTFKNLANTYPSQVTIYKYPTNMPPKCSGCDYCHCH